MYPVEWFTTEILRWRTGAAAVWSMMLTILFGFFFMIIATFSVWNPYMSVYVCLMRVVTMFDFWLLMIVLAFSVLIMARMNVSYLTVTCCVPSTRLEVIWNNIRPSRICFIAGHMLTSGVAAVCATKLVGGRYTSMSFTCPHDVNLQCLSEEHLFVVLYGCICGVISSVVFFATGCNLVKFPAISQRKLFEVKGSLIPLIVASARRSFIYLKYYYLAYCLGLGYLARNFVLHSMDLSVDKNLVELSTLRGLFNLTLFFYTWLIATFVDAIFSLPHLLFTVYYTEPLVFPVESSQPVMQDKCLHDAISCQRSSFLQYLGCLDLCRLAKFSPSRRQQIFSLTCLGGQPANWVNLSNACLAELNSFIDSLMNYGATSQSLVTSTLTSAPVLGGPAPLNISATPANISLLSARTNTVVNGSPAVVRGPADITTPGLVRRYTGTGQNVSIQSNCQSPQQPEQARFLTRVYRRVIWKLKQRPFIGYFLNETPETKSRRLFVSAQKYIFIIDGLSHLVCASFTEDAYGVVQGSLPLILSTLLNMLDVLDRHMKLCPIALRHPRMLSVPGEQFDVVLRFALKSSIKSALYRIVDTFNQHLYSIDLTAEHKRRLRAFEEFRE